MRPALVLGHNAPKLASMIYASLIYGGVRNGSVFRLHLSPRTLNCLVHRQAL